MGIYLPNMEMPKSGTYEVSIDNTNGKDKTIMSMFVRGSGGLICCGVYEIVPVSPHGDLIDRDPFIEFIKTHWGSYDQWFVEQLEARPTIIPASGGLKCSQMINGESL